MRLRHALLLILLLAVAPYPAWAAAQNDILIVVDTRSPGQKALEHALREVFSASRAQKGISSEALPIDTYDARIDGHRIAVQRLHIPMSSLPYLGIAQLDREGRPSQVVLGVEHVQSAVDGLNRLNKRYQALAARNRNASPITGIWKQFAYNSSGEPVYLLTMEVAAVGDTYHYTIEDVSSNSFIQKIHLFNTQVEGDRWEFDSDWAARGIAHFKLHRDGPNRYVGWSYLNGQQVEKQLWIRTP